MPLPKLLLIAAALLLGASRSANAQGPDCLGIAYRFNVSVFGGGDFAGGFVDIPDSPVPSTSEREGGAQRVTLRSRDGGHIVLGGEEPYLCGPSVAGIVAERFALPGAYYSFAVHLDGRTTRFRIPVEEVTFGADEEDRVVSISVPFFDLDPPPPSPPPVRSRLEEHRRR